MRKESRAIVGCARLSFINYLRFLARFAVRWNHELHADIDIVWILEQVPICLVDSFPLSGRIVKLFRQTTKRIAGFHGVLLRTQLTDLSRCRSFVGCCW